MSRDKATGTAQKMQDGKQPATANTFYAAATAAPAGNDSAADPKLAKFRTPKKRAPLLRKEQECCCRATD